MIIEENTDIYLICITNLSLTIYFENPSDLHATTAVSRMNEFILLLSRLGLNIGKKRHFAKSACRRYVIWWLKT